MTTKLEVLKAIIPIVQRAFDNPNRVYPPRDENGFETDIPLKFEHFTTNFLNKAPLKEEYLEEFFELYTLLKKETNPSKISEIIQNANEYFDYLAKTIKPDTAIEHSTGKDKREIMYDGLLKQTEQDPDLQYSLIKLMLKSNKVGVNALPDEFLEKIKEQAFFNPNGKFSDLGAGYFYDQKNNEERFFNLVYQCSDKQLALKKLEEVLEFFESAEYLPSSMSLLNFYRTRSKLIKLINQQEVPNHRKKSVFNETEDPKIIQLRQQIAELTQQNTELAATLKNVIAQVDQVASTLQQQSKTNKFSRAGAKLAHAQQTLNAIVNPKNWDKKSQK